MAVGIGEKVRVRIEEDGVMTVGTGVDEVHGRGRGTTGVIIIMVGVEKKKDGIVKTQDVDPPKENSNE